MSLDTSAIPRNPSRIGWRLLPELEAESRAFRARLPARSKLLIGLTPGPACTRLPDEQSRREDILCGWNAWIQADGLLTNLPPALPEVFFAGGGHLNRNGQKRFTAALAQALAPRLQPAQPTTTPGS